MVQSVREHYATHLSRIYAWLQGGVEAAIQRGDTELQALALHPAQDSVAVDLGAGFGMHAIPLARRGYSVIAIDTDAGLLGELARHTQGLPIRPVTADLLDFRAHLDGAADLILCMGDTLTHLANPAAVNSLLADVAATLRPDGVFVCTFRDYGRSLAAEQRFIPVRSDADRILTCFLEYGDQTVTVHDLLHERSGEHWRLSVSSYSKLRLAPGVVCTALVDHGFQVAQSVTATGVIRLVARPQNRS